MNAFKLIQNVVAFELGVDVNSMMSRCKDLNMVYGRQVSMWMSYHVHGAIQVVVGREFGVDPSTVQQGMKRIEDRRETEKKVAADLRRIAAHLIPILEVQNCVTERKLPDWLV